VCVTSSWTSATTIACGSGGIVQVAGYGAVTVGAVAGTVPAVLSFDAAVVSSLFSRNLAQSGGAWVSISGLDFGNVDGTVSSSLSNPSCSSASWTSSTSASCRYLSSLLSVVDVSAKVTLAAVAGTGFSAFSFDAPVSSFVGVSNVPLTAGLSITVVGLNLGSIDYTLTAELSRYMCSTLSWLTTTSVSCLSQRLMSADELAVTVGAVAGTGSSVFSFDAPVG